MHRGNIAEALLAIITICRSEILKNVDSNTNRNIANSEFAKIDSRHAAQWTPKHIFMENPARDPVFEHTSETCWATTAAKVRIDLKSL